MKAEKQEGLNSMRGDPSGWSEMETVEEMNLKHRTRMQNLLMMAKGGLAVRTKRMEVKTENV